MAGIQAAGARRQPACHGCRGRSGSAERAGTPRAESAPRARTAHRSGSTSHRLARWEIVPLIGSRADGSTVRLKFDPFSLNGS